MRKKVILVTGTERSGTHLATKLVYAMTHGVEYGKGWSGDNDSPEGGPIRVIHRSLPCGPDPNSDKEMPEGWKYWAFKPKHINHFYVDLDKWAEFYKDYDRQVVVITRCQAICALARVRTFGGAIKDRIRQGLYGQELVGSWLENSSERITLVSYETLCALKGAYLLRIAEEINSGWHTNTTWINIDPEHIKRLGANIVSGNPKYTLDEPPSGKTIPPAPNNLEKL